MVIIPTILNHIQCTMSDRSKLANPGKINVQKFPTSTIHQLNLKSNTDRSLSQEATDVACSMSTSLASVKRHQLVNKTPSLTPYLSPTATTEAAEDLIYCALCTPLGKDCPGKLAMSSDWDKKDDNTKEKVHEQSQAHSDLYIVLTKTWYHPSHI